jgi:pilus assembly protein CpaB
MKLSKQATMWLQVGGAVVLGISAYFLSKHLLDLEKQNLLSRFGASQTATSIIVASRPVEAGESLSAENLAAVEASLDFLPDDVLTAEHFADIAGMEIRQALAPGKPLLMSYIRPSVAERFSQLVGPGQRAVTLDVDNRMSIEGMIRVGDKLDLLIRTSGDSGGQLDVLAESVAVIATGSLRSASKEHPNDVVSETSADGFYTSITVILETETAARALLARETGELIALLRGPEDSAPLPFSSIDSSTGLPSQSVQFFSNARQDDGQLQPIALKPVRNHPHDLFRLLNRNPDQINTPNPTTQVRNP